ncbi:toxin-antitoxin system YwqK family antitoxin [Aquimarina sediminis]|uniref:toxin-antitoxin system YwqK family antitoxin n=1 Tax=Aquimarina sediminis TaxID=2070536 RepID=UPI000CA040D1|nr:hypothetical protein [Aquimarina sediminis]
MKKNILSLVLLCSFLSFSQKKVFEPITKPILSFDIKIENKNGISYYQYKDDLKPLNGVYNINIYIKDENVGDIEVSENGTKKRTLKYDLPNKNYINININEKGSFKNGYKTGLWKTTYKGKVIKTENWDNGLMIGKYRIYGSQGNLLYHTNFGSLGNGKYKDYYYKTNILKQEGNYENGQKEGEWCDYNKQGKMIKVIKYKTGNIVNE